MNISMEKEKKKYICYACLKPIDDGFLDVFGHCSKCSYMSWYNGKKTLVCMRRALELSSDSK